MLVPLTMTVHPLGAAGGFCVLRNDLESKRTIIKVCD